MRSVQYNIISTLFYIVFLSTSAADIDGFDGLHCLMLFSFFSIQIRIVITYCLYGTSNRLICLGVLLPGTALRYSWTYRFTRSFSFCG